MRSKSDRSAGALKRIDALREHASTVKPEQMPATVFDIVSDLLGPEAAEAVSVGELGIRTWKAIYNRDQVLCMSHAGTPIAEIAARLGLSYGHVCALRAQLRVGRKR